VNKCPFAVNNYERDGAMRVDGNGGNGVNYSPNSFDDIYADPAYKQPALQLDSTVADWYDRNAAGEDDHYTQPGWLYKRVMTEEDRKNLVSNIVGAMSGIAGPKRDLIINRQLCHFFRADVDLGSRVAKALGVTIDQKMFERV
jgi:catalase